MLKAQGLIIGSILLAALGGGLSADKSISESELKKIVKDAKLYFSGKSKCQTKEFANKRAIKRLMQTGNSNLNNYKEREGSIEIYIQHVQANSSSIKIIKTMNSEFCDSFTIFEILH